MENDRPPAMLALEDGTVFRGTSFGARGERAGEVVFNTSMMGYQEILTDPSYKGQIVTMTYPLIGNYGVNSDDAESDGLHLEGLVVREYSPYPSNWRSQGDLAEYLRSHDVPGMDDIDTRKLTTLIRTKGAMRGVISTQDLDPDSLVEKARKTPGLVGRDLVQEVTTRQRYAWSGWRTAAGEEEGQQRQLVLDIKQEPRTRHRRRSASQTARLRVIALDYGCKYNILRRLAACRCDTLVLSASVDADEVLSYAPDGVLLSSGPGDPEGVPYAVETVRRLIGKVPIMGVCLGHQILCLAFGGKTYKLKFGHHGGNQPVKNLDTGAIEITAQNHGFAADMDSLAGKGLRETHVNLNDQTNEGMRHEELPAFSMQFHPEAAPGPHDSRSLFDDFVSMMRLWTGGDEGKTRTG